MSSSSSHPTVGVPRWLVILGSVVIVFHFGTIAVRSMAAMSGPWTDNNGEPAPPPQFAFSIDEKTSPYLRAIKMDDQYRWGSNRPQLPAVKIEFKIKDSSGQEIATVHLPDENANAWVRHRQSLLAHGLGIDRPVALPQISMIYPPGQKVPEEIFWEEIPNEWHRQRLSKQGVDKFDRRMPYLRPSEHSLLFARSYARHLCRIHGGDKVEIIRHHKEPIPAAVLIMDNAQAGAFEEIISNYGEFSK